MSKAVRAVVALEDPAAQASVMSLLAETGEVEVLGYLNDLSTEHHLLQDGSAELVIIASSTGSAPVTALIEDASRRHPNRPVVVFHLGSAETNGFMQKVFAAGADDIINVPDTPERVRHALQKTIARRRGAAIAEGAAPGRLVCVLGPKGGTGKTITSCNLAVVLADEGLDTILVDLDLRFGDVGLGLQLAPQRTIYDLARSGGTLDEEKLDGFLTRGASRARVLLAPTRPDQAGAIDAELIAEIFAVARAMSDVVIVDTPAGFPPEVITTIDNSSDVCVVSMLDAFSLKDTKLALETLDRMGYPKSSVRLVLNRADSHVGISHDDVELVLGREPDVLIPSQRDIPRSVTEGRPIVVSQPKSPAGRAFKLLAALYSDPPVGRTAQAPEALAAAGGRSGFLRRR